MGRGAHVGVGWDVGVEFEYIFEYVHGLKHRDFVGQIDIRRDAGGCQNHFHGEQAASGFE